MTGNSTPHEKARAIILAALMVMSVFGMTVAFAGSAAAAVNTAGTPGDIAVGQDSVSQEFTIEVGSVGNDNTINVSADDLANNANISDAQATVTANTSGSASVTEFDKDANNITINVESVDGDTVNFDLNVSSIDTSDSTTATGLTYTVTDVANSDSMETDTFDLVGADSVTANDVDVSTGDETAYINVSHTDGADAEFAVYDGSNEVIHQGSDSVTGSDTGTGYTNYTVDLSNSNGNAFELGSYDVYAAADNASADFGAVTDENYQASTSFTLNGLNANSITGADGTPVIVAANDTEVTYELTLENTGNETVEQNVSLVASNANGSIDFTQTPGTLTDSVDEDNFTVVAFEENVSVGAGNTTNVTLTVNTADLPGASDNVNDYEIAGYTSGSPYSASTTDLKVGSSTQGSVTIQVLDGDSNRQENVSVELWLQSDYDDEALVLETKETNENGEVTFTGLTVGSDNNNQVRYTARAGADTSEFQSSTTTLSLYETTQTSDSSSLTLTRNVDADKLSIDDVDPSSTVDVGSTVDISTLVQTLDEEPVGDLSAFEDGTVEITNISSDGPAIIEGLEEGDTVTSDADGIAEFTGLTTAETFDELDKDTEVTIEFQASPAGDSPAEDVTATTTVTFEAEPPSGSGAISGDVYEYESDTQLSASDNTEGVSVHAVTMDRLEANSQTVENANTSASVRVVDNETGEVLNVETDYLFTNGVLEADDTKLSQNTSIIGTGFNAEDTDGDGNVNFSVHVLEAGDYTVQVSDNGSFEAPSEYTFTASNNLTYEATDDRYANVPADHTAQTDSDGEFRLTALYTNGSTGVDYAV
ncbi:surface glycoprotein, partial [Halolamina salina]